ncbi:myotubularin-related protein DDB_G0290005-like [Oppia nitens]|uniref:myotubularin-related protein DDB_G0290005-like n=1 Tax=Oppia nitens TaxID=1686743 RepID=UPI0023D9E08B|nr:myotubularin-related protein DDB_G0290005-like [Oppia nitens]
MYSKLLLQVLCLSIVLFQVMANIRSDNTVFANTEKRDSEPPVGQYDENNSPDGQHERRHHHHRHHHNHHHRKQNDDEEIAPIRPWHHKGAHRYPPMADHSNAMSQLMPLLKTLANRKVQKAGKIVASSDSELDVNSKAKAYVISKWKTQIKEMLIHKVNNESKVLSRTIDQTGETNAVVNLNAELDLKKEKLVNGISYMESKPSEKKHKHHHHKHHHKHNNSNHHNNRDNQEVNQQQHQQQHQQQNQQQYVANNEGQLYGERQSSSQPLSRHYRYKRDTEGGDDGQKKPDIGGQFLAKIGNAFKQAGQEIDKTVKEYAPKFGQKLKEMADNIFKPPKPNHESPTVAPKEGEE